MGVFGDIGGGIKDGLNDGLGALEDGVDAGKRVLGEGVDWGTDRVGEGLDRAGLHDAADAVEDWGDGVASDLGATPGEQQLGQTEQANELIHGKPDVIRASAGHLKDFSAAFDKVGSGLKKVDSSGWRGEGGNTFREKFGVHPTKWLHAADACETAADALEAYADTVRWAQGQARDAIELYKQGKRASEDAIGAYNARVDAYNAKVKADQDPGPRPEPFRDPGDADIRAAQEKLAEARKQRNSAALHAQDKVKEALTHAPAEPPPLDRLGNNITDGYQAVNTELTHLVGGAIKGTAGLLNFVRGLNPMDVYNLTHPAEYMQNVSMTLSGLVSTASHPERAAKAAVDGFKKDPSEFVGRLIPELIGTKGAGLGRTALRTGLKEGLESSAAHGLKHGDELADAQKAAQAGDAPKDWSDLARNTDHTSEKAIHADSVDPKVAEEFVDDQFPWLKDVNNRWEDGYTQNCAYTTISTARRMEGIEVSAAPREGPGHLPLEPFKLVDDAQPWQKVDNYDDIIRDLQNRGEGAKSAVFIGRGNSGHFFNAVNTEHGVVFLDGQTGMLGQLEKNVVDIRHVPYEKMVE
ncbi:putative T7SS-secreted protein [Streptomyces flaveus]|uniref:Tox-PL domain-containing protein n=1 Tax=Streptomyces flaveus TaxID=66370 RepID=A0A917R855_9ACTN|nr:toxin glutamine deamidase domain-containing protein [Streptomyces flaveus]GGK94610.1 hypothetical protein GCM10010094_64490 [Streptomyces flaveus]